MTHLGAIAAVAVWLAACGSPLPTATPTPLVSASPGTTPTATAPPPTAPPLDHPTGATDVVLRMSSGGGLPLSAGPTYSAPPTFTLYGDGRVIYLSGVTAWGAPPADILVAHMTEDQISSLLDYALTTAGLASARSSYEESGVYDAGTTYFDVRAAGLDKSVAVYALGFEAADGPDLVARRGFEALSNLLGQFPGEVAAGNAVALGTYEPSAYEVTLDRRFGPGNTANSPWPWTDLQPVDFGAIPPMGSASRQVTAAQGATVLALGLWSNLIVTGPDEILYQIKIKPLLPDEIDRDTGQGPLLELPLANAGR